MATMIPQEFIEEVSSKTNIADVVSKYVQLKKSGKNLFGLCPFQPEKTPSFSVSEDKQLFHCFSCGRGGNVFKFIMEIEDKSFPEAVIEVAEMGNITVPDAFQPSNAPAQNSSHRQLMQMYAEAAKLYTHILTKTDNGDVAMRYLTDRNITSDLIEDFDLGYAPNNSNLLLQFFRDRSIDDTVLRKSGLFAENESGELFDRFRDRVMIPIKDENGSIIAFSGRILNKADGVAKYLNSPETPIFNKGKTIFNINLAKHSIREKNNVILFEGFMDVMSAYKAGVTNGVASMGTSLTDDQLYSLSRLTDQINVCYDGDDPGVKATYRALTQLNDDRFTYGVISIPDKQDPDEYIRSSGPDKFKSLTENSVQTSIAFVLNYFKRQYNLTNEHDQIEYLKQAIGELVKLKSPIEQDMYVTRLAEELNVNKESIYKELGTARRKFSISQPANNYKNIEHAQLEQTTATVPQKFDRVEKSERNLIFWSLRYPEIRSMLKGNEFKFVHQNYQTIFDQMIKFAVDRDINDEIIAADFMNVLDEENKNVLADIEMMQMPIEYNDDEIKDYIANIDNSSLEFKINDINQQLKKAAMVGDNELQLQLTQELIRVRKLLASN